MSKPPTGDGFKSFIDRRMVYAIDKLNFPERLESARRAAHLSQADLGKAVRVTRSAVSFWEAGKAIPEITRAEMVANVLNVSLDWLLSGEGKGPALTGNKGSALKYKFKTQNDDTRVKEVPISSTWGTRPDDTPFDSAVAETTSAIGAAAPFTKTELVAEWWRVPARVVAEEFRAIKAKTLRMMQVFSENMAPEIKRRDFVVIDLAQRTPVDNGIFALYDNAGVILMRIRFVMDEKDKLSLHDHTEDAPVIVHRSKMKIVGRCVGHLRYP
ncbi:MAG TPA: helix-turn-helix domain-containing protein [Bradyrhizobium sp.]|jgi:transcriptional regulator with XRE-family HTH domain